MHQPYNELITDRSDIDTPSSPPAMFASARHWPRDLITTWVELAFSKLWLTVAGGGARQTENKRFDTYVNSAFSKYSLNGLMDSLWKSLHVILVNCLLTLCFVKRYRKEYVFMKVQCKWCQFLLWYTSFKRRHFHRSKKCRKFGLLRRTKVWFFDDIQIPIIRNDLVCCIF